MLKLIAWLLLTASAQGAVDPAYARYLNAARNWGPDRSTPGASLTATEIKRAGSTVSYRLSARGIDPSTPLVLVIWDLNKPGPVPAIDNLRVHPDGAVFCGPVHTPCGPDHSPNTPLTLTFSTAPGEPKRVALLSKDARVRAVENIVPFPLTAADQGCSVEIRWLAPDASAVLVRAQGFKPLSTIEFRGSSGGPAQMHAAKADRNGRFETVILPEVHGKTFGTHNLSLKSDACDPHIAFAWGKSR